MSSTPARPNSKIVELAAIGVTVIALFAALIWLAGVRGSQDTPESSGSSYSSGARGELALYRWLQASGFDVRRVTSTDGFPPDADIMFMINPNDRFPEGQASSVRRWVEQGRTLVLAISGISGDPSTQLGGQHPMLRELGVDLGFSPGFSSTVPLAQPIFSRPGLSTIDIPGTFTLELPITGTTVLASSKDEDGDRVALAAVMRLGSGQVFVLSSDYPLSNQGLGIADNWAFVYNMAQAAGGKRVAFDEAHHSVSEGGDLLALLANTPWGWALIYGALLIAAYFFWSARRLGPPLPVPMPDRRRPTSDYVTSVARLFRRARKPGYAAERYLQFFKRTLSHHAALDPFLTDSRFVQSLVERGRHGFDGEEMLRAIQRLRQLEGNASASESVELDAVKAIREAEKVRREALGIGDSQN